MRKRLFLYLKHLHLVLDHADLPGDRENRAESGQGRGKVMRTSLRPRLTSPRPLGRAPLPSADPKKRCRENHQLEE